MTRGSQRIQSIVKTFQNWEPPQRLFRRSYRRAQNQRSPLSSFGTTICSSQIRTRSNLFGIPRSIDCTETTLFLTKSIIQHCRKAFGGRRDRPSFLESKSAVTSSIHMFHIAISADGAMREFATQGKPRDYLTLLYSQYYSIGCPHELW
jgi:hypothetical protein